MNRYFLVLITAIGMLTYACSPKTTEAVTETKPVTATKVKPTIPNEDLSPCQKWTGESFEKEALEAHVLYRDQMRSQNYKEALPLWKKVYDLAPAADGRRDVHYMDGAKIYKHLITYDETITDAQKEEYKNAIFDLYNQAIECYPKKKTNYKSLMAYDYYFVFPGTKTDKEIYAMYKDIIDTDGLNTSVSVLNPMTALIVNQLWAEKIPVEEAKKYVGEMNKIFAYKKEKLSAADWKRYGWNIVESYMPPRLEQLEGIKGFYDCTYYKNKYLPEFKENPTDCEVIAMTIARLNYGGCDASDADLVAAKAARTQHCRVATEPVVAGPLRQAKDCLDNGDYDCAIQKYEEFVNSTDNIEKKAKYNLRIAKIYFAHKKKFSKAREYARKASKQRPNWGEPYMLIGTLYASSGPLCGPGTGFDSQRVVWAAIDKWRKAKSVDSNVTAKANKLINRYTQYMPTVEDLFQRGLKEGGTYKVPCWIQETTKIRAAK